MHWLHHQRRASLAAISAACIAMLLFGSYLQYGLGLEPCPMCIVQRYALIALALCSAAASACALRPWARQLATGLALGSAGFGAFTAARQSWLQWFPPEFATCGRDFYGMVQNYPLSRALPMIFRGSGDCSAVDWQFLGGSIANWAFLAFTAMGILLLLSLWEYGGDNAPGLVKR
ncbi:MAG: disulfide bond formation protein B [Comamonas sp.]|nr:disulfide bond formation protein B [Comamonas sp.]